LYFYLILFSIEVRDIANSRKKTEINFYKANEEKENEKNEKENKKKFESEKSPIINTSMNTNTNINLLNYDFQNKQNRKQVIFI
jgi:hypothetical protein